MLELVFSAYGSIYTHILENIYPAKNSTGFPERNLSVNFSKAYERIALEKGDNAYSWFEFQFGAMNSFHVDAVIINDTLQEIYIIESKRYSNPTAKMREVGEDIDRIYDFIEELKKENLNEIIRIDLSKFEHYYGIILADVWTETPLKKDILKAYEMGNFLDSFKKQIGNKHDLKEVQYFIQNFDYIKNVNKYHLISLCWEIR